MMKHKKKTSSNAAEGGKPGKPRTLQVDDIGTLTVRSRKGETLSRLCLQRMRKVGERREDQRIFIDPEGPPDHKVVITAVVRVQNQKSDSVTLHGRRLTKRPSGRSTTGRRIRLDPHYIPPEALPEVVLKAIQFFQPQQAAAAG